MVNSKIKEGVVSLSLSANIVGVMQLKACCMNTSPLQQWSFYSIKSTELIAHSFKDQLPGHTILEVLQLKWNDCMIASELLWLQDRCKPVNK